MSWPCRKVKWSLQGLQLCYMVVVSLVTTDVNHVTEGECNCHHIQLAPIWSFTFTRVLKPIWKHLFILLLLLYPKFLSSWVNRSIIKRLSGHETLFSSNKVAHWLCSQTMFWDLHETGFQPHGVFWRMQLEKLLQTLVDGAGPLACRGAIKAPTKNITWAERKTQLFL